MTYVFQVDIRLHLNPGCNPNIFRVGFVGNTEVMRQDFLRLILFSPSVYRSTKCSTLHNTTSSYNYCSITSRVISCFNRDEEDTCPLLCCYTRNIGRTQFVMAVFLFNTIIYVFLLTCLCILIVCLCIFIVPAGTLRLP